VSEVDCESDLPGDRCYCYVKCAINNYKKAQPKSLQGLRKSSGVVSCIASVPIDSVPMVSYYRPIVTVSKMHRFRDMKTY